MLRLPAQRPALYAQLAFAGVVLAVFTHTTFVDTLRGPPARVVATYGLAAVYTVLFSLVRPRFGDATPRRALLAYYAIQVAVVAGMILASPSRGFFAILSLPLVSQALFDFGLRGSTLVALGAFVPSVAVWMHPYGFSGLLRAVLTYAPAFLFTITFTLITRKSVEARATSERLAAELAAANDLLLAQAAQTAELAVARERNRLAREIHDGVGHYLVTVKVQLDAASALLPADPARAAASVATAARLAGEALDDVRRSVRTLATDAPRPPFPDTLRRLAADAAPVPSIQISGTPRPLPSAVEHALFRAAQEALTNLRKHATAPSATLTLDYSDPARIRLALADDGRGPVPAASAAAPSGGYGLVGLRERCALLGGHLAAGPRPAGGWLLEVDLPT